MTDPVNRTILLFDIEQFGKRDDVEQAFLRRLLYDVADATLTAAHVDETTRLRADRGDSVMELIDAQIPVPGLLKTLLTETPALLHHKNRLIAASTQMRLRIVLSTGYVAVDGLDGWVGSDLNHACRLLDAAPLREALKQHDGDCVLCVSDGVYQGVVRQGHLGVRPEEFRRITVEAKEGPTVAWLHGTLGEGNPASQRIATASDPRLVPGAQHNETHVGGNHYGPSGGETHGGLSYRFDGRENR